MLYMKMLSPVGTLSLAEEDGAIVHLEYNWTPPAHAEMGESALLLRAKGQLEEYFAGIRREFDLPLHPRGTEFQLSVWRALCEIPYGQTRSYADIARAIGRPKSCRAVGGANHVNPISIIIPCHRVIGASGKMVGYGGGLWIKETLLKLEAEHA